MKAAYESYGSHLFKGAASTPYLEKEGLPVQILDSPAWTKDLATADKVAAAVLAWALDNGADSFCHWVCCITTLLLRDIH